MIRVPPDTEIPADDFREQVYGASRASADIGAYQSMGGLELTHSNPERSRSVASDVPCRASIETRLQLSSSGSGSHLRRRFQFGLVVLLIAPALLCALSVTPSANAQVPDLRQCSVTSDPISETLPPVVSTLSISVLQPIVDPRIELNLAHTFVGDLEISVTSPSGTTVVLHDNGGASSMDFSLTYWDSGISNVAPYDCGCLMAPSGPGRLRDWQGEVTAGLWTLTVTDLLPGDEGTLLGWCFENYLTVPPAPVENLTNRVDLQSDRADVNWNNIGSYDEIRVWLADDPIATLPGTATSWQSPRLRTGRHVITIVPIAAGEALEARGTTAVRADAEVRNTPVAPIASTLTPTVDSLLVSEDFILNDVQCTIDIQHSWVSDLTVDLTSPGGTTVRLHDREGGSQNDLVATFTQDGVPHGSVPFGRGAFMEPSDTDNPDHPNGLYEFQGESSLGFWTLTVVDSVTDDDGVLNEWGWRGFADGPPPPVTSLTLTPEVDDPLRVRVRWDSMANYDGIEILRNGVPDRRLPGNQTETVVLVESAPEVLEIGVRGRKGMRTSETMRRSIYVDIPPVSSLACKTRLGSGLVEATWDVSLPYHSFLVYVDGELEAQLPPNARRYTTAPRPLLSTITVSVVGRLPMPPFGLLGSSPPRSCEVDLEAPTESLSLIFAGENGQGLVDSVGALEQALAQLPRSTGVVTRLRPRLIRRPRDLWVLCGTFPDNHVLTPEDGEELARLARDGVPIYIEGADVWGFDAPTAFAHFDGISNVAVIEDGDDSLSRLVGRQSHLGLDLGSLIDWGSCPSILCAPGISGPSIPYQQDSLGNDATDRLIPASGVPDVGGPAAAVIWESKEPRYAVGVFYRSTFNNVIAQSWEFGGYSGDREELARIYVGALQLPLTPLLGTRFVRGDANADGSVDIGDGIFVLSTLFDSDAPGPPCQDSADTNDDGSIDIGDAISVLFTLFGGGPPIPAPSSSCAPDPSADSLDCGSYAGCP